jgi:hypothetical protein
VARFRVVELRVEYRRSSHRHSLATWFECTGEAEQFHGMVDIDSRVCIRGPYSAAFYPPEAWLPKFMRHLQMGYFSAAKNIHPCPAVQ